MTRTTPEGTAAVQFRDRSSTGKGLGARTGRRLRRRARALPLGWMAAGALMGALVAIALGAALAAGALVVAALGLGWLERSAHRGERVEGLRARHRQLSERVERLDDLAFSLRESEEMHRSLVDTFGDLVVHRDADGAVRFANAAFRRAFATHGAGLPEVLEAALACAPVREGADGAKIRTVSVETREGPRTFAWADVPARDLRTGAPGTRSLARDVSDHEAAIRELEAERDRAEERNAMRSRFLATAAHEIRNPLNGLNGMAALLKFSKLDARQESQVDAIASATSALAHLIEDLLDDARMQADRLTLEDEPLDPGALVDQVAELMATRAHAKGIDIVTHVGATVPQLVCGDAGRLRQILLNLLGNAVKFTAQGAVTLVLRFEDGRLAFEVIDTGPGMSAEDCARIFTIFEHADEGLARRLGGVGMGLTISRQIADRMGGTITVHSTPGEGSRFTFEVPVDEAGRSPAEPTLSTRTVALVTDNPAVAGPLRLFVAERGGEVVVMDATGFNTAHREGWAHGALLVDEKVVPTLGAREGLASAVLLRRSEAGALPAGFERWLRLPWRSSALQRVLHEGADLSEGSGEARRKVDAPSLETGLAEDPAVAEPETLVPVDPLAVENRVLVAEDDPVTQLLTRTWLERAGHDVSLVEDGDRASRAFREAVEGGHPFDAVVLDLNMPGLDGFAALRGMREIERRRRLAPAPIVVATGDPREETAAKAREAGASAVLVKPVDMDTLEMALRERASAAREKADA